MIIRLAIILLVLTVIILYLLRLFGIRVGLTPRGKTAFLKGLGLAVRLLLRRIGL